MPTYKISFKGVETPIIITADTPESAIDKAVIENNIQNASGDVELVS